ncbi:uncharacterized protein CcaverHIS019_0211200 [Cutaneotrichosporon cavernicola]|uniref:FAD-binding FR-type domain-containing protein n=1 Tax=Cutaneotrichosporon cavernicola TaxID=279322 RepID=A0AA48IG60_9TREE|nr:uncharacterized protein CcaverHIS019_0211200 [Cutaneotrichosporon cavernicola]BEI89758.1 hypothetical protein CcaverHIS019_0211200 [Cutaneotrichosporon cavernicola]BEJ05308.1 hypothetical protein CcaverHIS641_0211250 [Cutaneotrichosporon cavernicola]
MSRSFTPSFCRALPTPPAHTTRFLIPGTPRARRRLLAVLALIPFLAYYLNPKQPLNPQVYSDHPVTAVDKVGPAHVELVVGVSEGERGMFGPEAVSASPYGVPPRPPNLSPSFSSASSSQPTPPSTPVVVQHIMVKNPDLMIERAYTPVNDVSADGIMRMIVKRVRGGEVGRLVHTRNPGDMVGLRGPVATFAITPSDYDRIVMISTGTAVAPFLQLLAKDTPGSGSTQYTLLQQSPSGGREDWSADYIAPMAAKWGEGLEVRRIPPGIVKREDVTAALKGAERPLVLVCLPTGLMRPLCGALAPTLHQGPLVGLLRDMGLRPDQVWKLDSSVSAASTTTSICRPPQATAWTDCGPVKNISYLSPAFVYSPKEGWHKNGSWASGSGSVSVQLSSSGVTWAVDGPATILVNGTETTAQVGNRNRTVSGLPYGWHNFTLVGEGLSVGDVMPIEDGSTFLPATPGASQLLNTSSTDLFSSSGFNSYGGLTTNSSAKITLTPPLGSATIELLSNYIYIQGTRVPDSPQPWGAFSVIFDPAPPYGPATQSFAGSLYPSTEQPGNLIADGTIHALILRAELDPAVKYTVTVDIESGQWKQHGPAVPKSHPGPEEWGDAYVCRCFGAWCTRIVHVLVA